MLMIAHLHSDGEFLHLHKISGPFESERDATVVLEREGYRHRGNGIWQPNIEAYIRQGRTSVEWLSDQARIVSPGSDLLALPLEPDEPDLVGSPSDHQPDESGK